jgi:hypothetical protein
VKRPKSPEDKMWSKKPVVFEDSKAEYHSVVFSWDLWEWTKTIQPPLSGKQVIVGGPAVELHQEWVPDWVKVQKVPPEGVVPLRLHNPEATRTSIGCMRKCARC